MEPINGKRYPLWEQFVDRKDEWIGGTLVDVADGAPPTTIIDVTLSPNGSDSAAFDIVGEHYSCGFDVRYGGIVPGDVENGLMLTRLWTGDFSVTRA